ncbi:hypothetical protein [Sorangium sp. So ce406]|uniref:hypothetical protein n=1 Tax=unclassified Sorangium TaxID=2621164 RepID=UPI003F5CB422
MKNSDFLLEDLEETIVPADMGAPVLNIPVLVMIVIFATPVLTIRRFATVAK